jgi:glycosyltransferase involved in cell wall biosynthesis
LIDSTAAEMMAVSYATPAQPRRLRVAFLATSFGGGGVERQTLLLARELRATHEIAFLALRPTGLFAGIPADLGLPVHALGWSEKSFREAPVRYVVKAARSLINYLRLARGFDIVDARLPPGYALAGLAQPLARVPVLVAGRRVMADVTLAVDPFRRRLARLAMREVDAVVANSDAVARDAMQREGLSALTIHVIRNGVDMPDVSTVGRRAELRRAWHLDGNHIVGCVANYTQRKGLETLIDVAVDLRARNPNIRYVLIGEGPLRSELAAQISRLRLDSVVILLGAHPDATEVYPAFDTVVHPSETEGLPNAVLEAAAWGKPIVATDVGGTREIVRDGREALLVPPNNADALGQALMRIVTNRELAESLGNAARDRVMQSFSAAALGTQTAVLYQDLYARSRRRRHGPR